MVLSFDFASLRRAYARGEATPVTVMREAIGRIAARGSDAVWISRFPDDRLLDEAMALEWRTAAEGREHLPLYGIPFAVKDNIDGAGLSTTAACPEAAYLPPASAPVVERLRRAGALLVGKTNLDQFATGLVGTRSPYGTPRNPFDPAYIPGGSSSGSAVAVAAGLVGFALGTDTAGSGRVPAGFNNIVGLKPSKGLIGTQGIVPACASLDCVSVFALTVGDAAGVCEFVQDGRDRGARARFTAPGAPPARFAFGVPREEQREFCGDGSAATLFAAAIARLAALGGDAVPIDFAPFIEAGALVYDRGPWLAERRDAVDAATGGRRDLLQPVTRRIIDGAEGITPADISRGRERLASLARQTAPVWRDIDLMLVPTTPTIYRIDEIAEDPIGRNALLGRYTNFVNLLDLAAIALPNGFLPSGLPTGVTLVAPALHDQSLAAIGAAFAAAAALPLGATGIGT